MVGRVLLKSTNLMYERAKVEGTSGMALNYPILLSRSRICNSFANNICFAGTYFIDAAMPRSAKIFKYAGDGSPS